MYCASTLNHELTLNEIICSIPRHIWFVVSSRNKLLQLALPNLALLRHINSGIKATYQ